MKYLKRFRVLLPLLIIVCMMFAGAENASADTRNFLSSSETIKVVSVDEEYELIDGVYEATITLKNTILNKNVKAHVLLVEPDAKASFKVALPGYYSKIPGGTAEDRRAMEWTDSDFKNMGVTNMIKDYQSAGDAKQVLAAINADFSNATALNGSGRAPRGTVIIDGVERSHSISSNDQFLFGRRTTSGVMNIVQRGQGQDSTFEDALTAPQYIVRNGKVCNFSEEYSNGVAQHRQRTGAGIRTNGDVILITVESGMLMEQLGDLMKASGCFNGVNFDGGGSINFQTDRNNGAGIVRRTPATSEMGSYTVDENGDRLLTNALMLVADDEAVANNVGEVSGHKIATDKKEYMQGESIYVTASSEEDGAWVGLFPADKEDVSGGSLAWYYVYGGNGEAGTWCWDQGATIDFFAEASSNGPTSSAGLTPGNYKVCVVDNNGVGQATAEFTIIEDPNAPKFDYTVKTDKDVYEVGEPIMTTVTAPDSDKKAWVGITETGHVAAADNATYYWYYSAGTNAGIQHSNGVTYNLLEQEQIGDDDIKDANVNASLIDRDNKVLLPGTYDIIVYPNDGYTPAVVNGETVKKTIQIVDTKAVYNITYKDGTKELTGLTPATYTYLAAQDGAIALPETASKDGHDFAGWYEKSDFSGTAVTEIAKGSNGNKTFYAKFMPKIYDVKFDTDGGTSVETQKVAYGSTAVTPDVVPEKEGFIFLGWATEDGTTYTFKEPITGETTIYAQWADDGMCRVTFDTTGGSDINPVAVENGGKIEKPADPTKKGYTFDKWVTRAGGYTPFDFDAEITKDQTAYASWKVITYKVTFDTDGGQAVSDKTYTVETETFTLPVTAKDGYKFLGWKDADGNTVTEIATGTVGNITLTAQWQREMYLDVDKDTYVEGEAINVSVYCDEPGAWVGLYKKDDAFGPGGVVSYFWTSVSGQCDFNMLAQTNQGREGFGTGEYQVILFCTAEGSDYHVLQTKDITITESSNPAKGTLKVSGANRDDKEYSGKATDKHGVTLYEFCYGEAINVEATVSGDGTDEAWVCVVSDDTYATGYASYAMGDNWFYVKDFEGQKVNLNYVKDNELSAEATHLKPYGLNQWIVIVSNSGKILDGVPMNNRTFNVDWFENLEGWGAAVRDSIIVEMDWTSAVENGKNQQPKVTLKHKGHFGLKEVNGELVEITEETLVEGYDYTLEYPAESKEVGTYTIKVTFPQDQPAGENDHYDYLSAKQYTNPEYFGFKEGISYFITATANDHVIKYELGGGKNNADNPSVYQTGTEITLKAPTRVGYVFGGWYTTAGFQEGTQITKIAADSTSDYTLYAKWTSEAKASYKITYKLFNKGDNPPANPTGYTGEADVALKAAEPYYGYKFEGWFFDEAFTKPADVIAKGTTGDLTVYAKFVKEQAATFDITTDVTYGSISDNVTVNAGESYTVTYTANEGYKLKKVTVDGVDVDINQYAESYTFENVNEAHSIYVEYYKPVLAKPTGVKAKLYGYNDVKVSWNKVPEATGYYVYVKKATSSKYTLLKTTTATSLKKANLSSGVKYNFKVVPYVTIGGVKYKASKYTTVSTTTLKKVAISGVAKSGSKVKVKWKNIAGETGYQISKSTKKNKTNIVATVQTTTGKSKVVKATKGKKYYYKVRAYKVVDGKKIYGPWSSVKAYKR